MLDRLDYDSDQYKQWLQQQQTINDNLEAKFAESQEYWNNRINPLYKKLTGGKEMLLELEVNHLNLRQDLVDEIRTFKTRLYKEVSKQDKYNAARWKFYATGYGLTTNMGDRKTLINADLEKQNFRVKIIDSFLSFLLDTKETCDKLGWSIKHRLEMENHL